MALQQAAGFIGAGCGPQGIGKTGLLLAQLLNGVNRLVDRLRMLWMRMKWMLLAGHPWRRRGLAEP